MGDIQEGGAGGWEKGEGRGEKRGEGRKRGEGEKGGEKEEGERDGEKREGKGRKKSHCTPFMH